MEGAIQMDGTGCDGAPQDRRNQRHLWRWALVWMASVLAGRVATRLGWLTDTWWAVAVVLVTAAFGVGLLFAYQRYLKQTDELRRKIELDALAVTTGVAIVGGMSWRLLAKTGAVPEADLAEMIAVMSLVYVVGVLVGRRRYR